MKLHRSLLAAALLLAAGFQSGLHAQPVSLSSTWIEYDLEQEKGQSVDGLAILSGQSSSGFTAFIKSNVLNATVLDFPPKSQYLPRIVTTFPDVPITNLGSRVTVSFDVVVNTPIPAANNVGFRLELGDTNANNGVLLGFDWGDTASQSVLVRYDATITQNTNWLDPVTFFYLNTPTNRDYAWGSFTDGGANYNTGGLTTGAPNNVSLKPGSKHSFKFSLERTASGLMVGSIWGNDAGPAVISTGGNPLQFGNGDDNNGFTDVRPWRGVNCFGICLFGTGSNPVSWDANGGSYTVSNLKIHSGINITTLEKNPASGDVTLTWESHPSDSLNGALYDVQYATNLTSPTWISLANTNLTSASTYPEGFLTSYTNAAPADLERYYRVQKVYP